MNGDEKPSAWTPEIVRDYVVSLIDANDRRYDDRFAAQEKAVNSALIASEKAVLVAETNAEKWRCVAVETPVLCADLIWRAAGSLKAGDELIAFDEHPLPPQKRWGRRFRRATATSNAIETAPILLVRTPLGSVRCSYGHPWLARRVRKGTWEWIEAQHLKPGDEVQHVVAPWTTDYSWNSGWLAGMYDGEGCLHINADGSAQLSMTQRQSDTADRILRVIAGYVGDSVCLHQKKEGIPKARVPILTFTVAKRSNVMMLLGTVRPPRLLVKSSDVWEGKPLGGPDRHTFVSSIEREGDGQIALLGTSTGTYIAGGFAMHNSNANEWRAAMSDREGRFASRGDLNALKERIDRSEGKGQGFSAMWGFVVGGVGLLAALLAVFVSFRAPSAATPQVVYVPAPPGALLPSTPPTVPR